MSYPFPSPHFAPQSKPSQCIGFFFTLVLQRTAKSVFLCVRSDVGAFTTS